VLTDPQVHHRRMVVDLPHPRHGTVSTLGTPVKVDGAMEAPLTAPARLGEHTDAILGDLLKYPAERLAALRRQGVVK